MDNMPVGSSFQSFQQPVGAMNFPDVGATDMRSHYHHDSHGHAEAPPEGVLLKKPHFGEAQAAGGDFQAALPYAKEMQKSLHDTGKLPDEFVNKSVAMKAGWRPGKTMGNYLPGKVIGGDIFTNIQILVPDAPGRTWHEADVASVSTKPRSQQHGWRLLYSEDGLCYLSVDHYKSVKDIGNWK
jgi:hypothetical protein